MSSGMSVAVTDVQRVMHNTQGSNRIANQGAIMEHVFALQRCLVNCSIKEVESKPTAPPGHAHRGSPRHRPFELV